MVMNDSKDYHLRDLLKHYSPIEIIKSSLTSIIFFLFPTVLIITIAVNITVLYIFYLYYILIGIYLVLVVLSIYTNKIFIQTLKNYIDKSNELDYDNIRIIINIISGFLLLIPFIISFIYFS